MLFICNAESAKINVISYNIWLGNSNGKFVPKLLITSSSILDIVIISRAVTNTSINYISAWAIESEIKFIVVFRQGSEFINVGIILGRF